MDRYSEKIENLLNLSLEATPEERAKSWNLPIGYEAESRSWEVIVKYSRAREPEFLLEKGMTALSFGYGIVRLTAAELQYAASLEEVEYIEKPKGMIFAVEQGKRPSCFPLSGETGLDGAASLVSQKRALNGKGVLLGIIDSGIDYLHPDFRKADGSTRIAAVWDQGGHSEGGAVIPPEGFRTGVEYTEEDINEALKQGDRLGALLKVPLTDPSGHGTQVLGIAAGNGMASGGKYAGGAPESTIVAVKLGGAETDGFPNTVQVMEGIEYLVRKAEELQRPMAINLSFGNVYGSQEPYTQIAVKVS